MNTLKENANVIIINFLMISILLTPVGTKMIYLIQSILDINFIGSEVLISCFCQCLLFYIVCEQYRKKGES